VNPVAFLLRHPYSILFGSVLLEQLGLPLPAAPLLLGAGALYGAGRLDLPPVLAVSLVACLIADVAWYEAGRLRGAAILRFLCRLWFAPDSCVKRTEGGFARYGQRTLLVAKFLPGLSAIATPLAGVTGLPRARFLMLDLGGALVWVGTYVGLGYVFSDSLEWLIERLTLVAHGVTGLVFLVLGAYVVVKFVRRRLFLRTLRLARITAVELRERLARGEALVIIDLRSDHEYAAAPGGIPGALRFRMNEIADRHREIPRDRDVVVYCTCPDEEASARVALLLHSRGILRVHPLEGGLGAWLGLPPAAPVGVA
jgi:membrane protein DedA with SNARE-associated domain/rhodanese-related sulfurtransferase